MSVDAKAGRSTICRRGDHRQCATARAVCACDCHPKRKPPKARVVEPLPQSWTKETAPCCQSRVDALGRPPIGFCSPECVRRPR